MGRPLAPRSILLLRLIRKHSVRHPDGTLRAYWIPRAQQQYVEDRGAVVAIWVNGSGDAARLRSLMMRGFTEKPPGSENVSAFAALITPKGIAELEKQP